MLRAGAEAVCADGWHTLQARRPALVSAPCRSLSVFPVGLVQWLAGFFKYFASAKCNGSDPRWLLHYVTLSLKPLFPWGQVFQRDQPVLAGQHALVE